MGPDRKPRCNVGISYIERDPQTLIASHGRLLANNPRWRGIVPYNVTHVSPDMPRNEDA